MGVVDIDGVRDMLDTLSLLLKESIKSPCLVLNVV